MPSLELYNAATIRAPARLFDPHGGWASTPLKVRWGFMELPGWGVTLIDTGYGPRCYGRPTNASAARQSKSLGLRLYTTLFRATLREEGQLGAVLAAKGLTPQDVQTVIVTHLHADHISELRTLSRARFLGSRQALETVQRAGWRGPLAHGSFLELLPEDYSDRLAAIEDRPGVSLPLGLGQGWEVVPDAVSLVPLPGHAAGHVGVFLHDAATLYAVDAHWVLSALSHSAPLSGLPRRIASDVAAAEESLARLRAFERAGGQTLFCHDPADTPFDVA
jgi:glyoxylase-like metal-dependent hydrolase (beta-lactamase superfamily II)